MIIKLSSSVKVSLSRCLSEEGHSIILVVFEAIAHLHQSGIIHCDIKPANIVMNAENQPVVLDFDVSKSVDQRSRAAGDAMTTLLKATSALAGRTPLYMAPELSESGAIPTSACDMYSLGLVLLDLLYPSNRSFPPNAKPEAAELIRALLKVEPKDRPSARRCLSTLKYLSFTHALSRPKLELSVPLYWSFSDVISSHYAYSFVFIHFA